MKEINESADTDLYNAKSLNIHHSQFVRDAIKEKSPRSKK
jgi:hypothetical protein